MELYIQLRLLYWIKATIVIEHESTLPIAILIHSRAPHTTPKFPMKY